MKKNISLLVSSFKKEFKDLNYSNIYHSRFRFRVSGFKNSMISQVLLERFINFASSNSLYFYVDFDLESFVFHF